MNVIPNIYVKLFLFFLCLSFFPLNAQRIAIDNTLSVQELIENNLVLGCVEVSNIKTPQNGQANGLTSYGYFDRANSNFPFEYGIVLTTGNVDSAGDDLITDRLNEGDKNWETDPDLETALGINDTHNATTIEFDFISGTNAVNFNYILASEEYLDAFPCDYSDGFAFLIRKTNSTEPYTNIALIPETQTPVNTTTVHDEIVGFCPAENETYFKGYNIGDTNYNGRTTVLTATTTITPNVLYHIKLIIADQTDSSADSAVFIEGNSFSTDVSLGENILTCERSAILNANTDNPNANYTWYKDDILLTDEISKILNIIDSGTYRVEIEVPLNGTTCTFDDEIIAILNSIQLVQDLTNFETCDDISNDSIEIFDLKTKDAELITYLPVSNYTISYHASSLEVENNQNPFTSYTSASPSQTIYARAEDIASGCVFTSKINIIVNPYPIIMPPTEPIKACEDKGGILSSADDSITGGNPDYKVTYHTSQTDAETGTNPLISPYIPVELTEELFVRVVDINSGCSATTTATIVKYESVNLNYDLQQIDACEQDGDGYAYFDITSVIEEVLDGETNVTVTYHPSKEDANNNTNVITDPSNYQNTILNMQIVYIRVQNNDSPCFSIMPIELHTNILLTATNLTPYFFECDTAPDDGLADFDLNDIEALIVNGVEDVTITFYETEADQISENNPLDKTILYSTVETDGNVLFFILESPTCKYLDSIILIVTPSISIADVTNQSYCNTNDSEIASIDLTTFDSQIADNITNAVVEYYETLENAELRVDRLPNPYINTTNPVKLYALVYNNVTQCSDIGELIIDILPAPVATNPTPFIICDDDQDGRTIINLEDKITEIVTDTTGLDITFHKTIGQAVNESAMITLAANFETNTTTVFTRIENTITGCYIIKLIEIIVNTKPNSPSTISDFVSCETDGDQIGEFIFKEKDLEILNGQTDKEVLYFETEADAISGTATPIDKTTAFIYANTTAAKLIYVRVQNLTDSECFGTASFSLKVGSVPVFTVPNANVNTCDDISNDGFHTFDLQNKIDEIIGGRSDLTVMLYSSQENLDNNIPLTDTVFTNTANPQEIFVVIDNGTICSGYASFRLNVVQVPVVFDSEAELENCDSNLNGHIAFNLTTAESDVLDTRQNDIIITYFENEDDLNTEINPILNPKNYVNVVNPQTVYMQVKNEISSCTVSVPIKLIVKIPPRIPNISTFETCENSDKSYDLNETIDALTDGQENVLITFYNSQSEASEGTSPLSSNYNYLANNDKIYVRSEFIAPSLAASCFSIGQFSLKINTSPPLATISNLENCDDDYDGLLIFNIETQSNFVIRGLNPNNYTITYFNTQNDANNNENIINDTKVVAENNQTFYIRVENKYTSCFSTTSFNTIIHRKPEVDITDQVVCLDNLPLIVSAETDVSSDTYLWSTGETTSIISIQRIGTYSVTVRSLNNCSTTSTFNVTESEKAKIEFTETVDFSYPHNITVTVSGIGNYQYQFDDREPQASNVFENVPIGPHTITIIDLNGCNSISKNIVIVDTPKFFTPNGDGHFDTWHITGVNQLIGTQINIHNRKGKLIKVLYHNSQGWDGTYNGYNMPASDYWFVAQVTKGGVKFELKGHFSLRR